MLSVSDFLGAIKTLIRNNELYLAYYISKYFAPEALPEVSLLLSEKVEKYFQTDICLRLLDNESVSSLSRKVNLCKRRLITSGLLRLPQ